MGIFTYNFLSIQFFPTECPGLCQHRPGHSMVGNIRNVSNKYRYWYNNGCLLPEMGSVFIPVDNCTKENGCLKVLDGSHKLGRINHILEGDQAGADPER